jgi:D-glycero-alpha-D-manno-heptose-7-phosphate kinase
MKIVTTKTPLRISFVGGGTDFEKFYKKNEGLVSSSTINKFIYVTVKKHSKLFQEKYRLNYSDVETVNDISSIKNHITRECLKFLKIKFSVYISTVSDIPTSSGLGSSSAFTVGLLLALNTLIGKKITKKKLAEDAFFIEKVKLKRNLGKQDQYAASFGGLNSITFKKNGITKINRIKISRANNTFLSNNMLLIWTGQTRNSNKILQSQEKNINKKLYELNQMKNLAKLFIKVLKEKKINLKKIAKLININWEFKKKLSNKIFDAKLKRTHHKILKSKILASKLLGAGGGGFFLIVDEKRKLNKLIKNKSFTEEKFKFVNLGSRVIYKA